MFLKKINLVLISIVVFLLLYTFAFDRKGFNADDGSVSDLLDSYTKIKDEIVDDGLLSQPINYNDPALNQRKVILIDELNQITIKQLMQKLIFLDAKQPGEPIDLYLDTVGGVGGLTIVNFFQTLQSPVNVYGLDWVMSGGSIILAGATGKRYTFSTSRISIHFPLNEADDDAHPEYDAITQTSVSEAAFWSLHTKLPQELISIEEERYLYLTPQQALKFGLVDEILPKR